MSAQSTILIADDDTSVLSALQMLLKSQLFNVVAVTSPEALIEQVKKRDFSAALIDLNYRDDTTSGHEGLALIEQINAENELLPVIVMTGYSSIEIAVDAMKKGASDFIQKPWSNERLLHTLRTQITLKQVSEKGLKLATENNLLKSEVHHNTHAIVAQSTAMQSLLAKLTKLAKSDMSILFTGENGTGKSMLAEYVHQQSQRHDNPFIAVNMGAVAETLFESEMFGHVKGAFTDAKENRIGRFELAQTGTIFLDEIANIGMAQQAKLLRVLEERCFEKVGSSKTQSIDVRLISATNADIQSMIQDALFRQDLLYRLNTITIEIPPLRMRQDDIFALANSFMQKHAKKYALDVGVLSDTAKTALASYAWPGNIRELSHVIERAMFMRSKLEITEFDLALPTTSHSSLGSASSNTVNTAIDWQAASLDEIEKNIIEERIKAFDNNPLEIAKSLGLSRSAYYRRLEKYGLN